MSFTGPVVFLVEDETSIAEAVGFALQGEGFRCQHYATGNACLAALDEAGANAGPVAILLDIGLPDGSGFDFFRRIRESCDTPVIFLTARSDEIDRVAGLEMGADDYVVKPFSVRELMARVRMVIRRQETAPPPTPVAAAANRPAATVGPFGHDEQRRQINYHGIALSLTLHEYRLLVALLKHPGHVRSREQLLEQAWDAPDHRLERTIDTHIKSLRAKLREITPDADPIRTHRGMGYSLELPQPDAAT
ncbi:MAG: two-component system response regulator CreB [Gammaproteobacteria bacterium]|nr:two-component system response regulator CreB [Gammaproteobacteria bacterium]